MHLFNLGERWGSNKLGFPGELVGTVSASNTVERYSEAYPEGYSLGRVGTTDAAFAKVGVVSSNLIARSNST